jgi:hypothetical protein
MNKSQSNYFNMGKGVYTVFQVDDAWKGVAMIEEGVENIGNLCDQITEEIAKQKKNETPGYTAGRERRRTALEDVLYAMGVRLKVYAQRTEDDVLAALVSFSRSALDTMGLNKLLGLARTVCYRAAELLPALELYQIAQADVDGLLAAIATTEETNAYRDAVRSEHTGNTAQLGLLLAALRKELKLMDTQVEAFVKDEEFRRIYFAARRVHDVRGGNGSKKTEGN